MTIVGKVRELQEHVDQLNACARELVTSGLRVQLELEEDRTFAVENPVPRLTLRVYQRIDPTGVVKPDPDKAIFQKPRGEPEA